MVEVRADSGDGSQHLGAAARERRVLHRVHGDTLFHPVALRHLEDEIAGHGVHLSTAHVLHQKAAIQILQDVFGRFIPGSQKGIAHAGDREMPVAFPATVARDLHTHLPGGLAGLQIIFQDAIFDEHYAANGIALVIHALAAPLEGQGAIVNDRDAAPGHPLAQFSREGAHARQREIRLQPVTAGFVDHGPPGGRT